MKFLLATKIRSLWELLKSGMFPLSIWELFRPAIWPWNLCARSMSFGLFCAARPHIYFYILSDVSLTVEIGLNSRTVIVIAGHVWVCPWSCLWFPSGSFLEGLSSRILVVFEVLCCSFRMSSKVIWVSVLKICSLCQGHLSRNSKHTYTNRIFKSVYWGLN